MTYPQESEEFQERAAGSGPPTLMDAAWLVSPLPWSLADLEGPGPPPAQAGPNVAEAVAVAARIPATAVRRVEAPLGTERIATHSVPGESPPIDSPRKDQGSEAQLPPWAFAIREAHDASPAARSTAATLEAEGVSCWFGRRKVLEDVTLTMLPNHVTALIGPSGCGKSTFLRALNRMHELVPGAALAGRVMLDGTDIYGRQARPTETRLHIGMVFQKPNPFPSMTIAQNVLSGLKLSGTKVADKDDVVETSLRRAGLWNETRNRLNTPGGALSGGQQQRLCIARALAVNPKVLLMDEPCSALDPISTGVIEETISSIKNDVTIVIVTHNMQQAARVSDQCALFLIDKENDPGVIVEAGDTAQLFSNPINRRTEDYINGRFG